MKEATINIKVVEETGDSIGIYADMDGEIMLVLEGLIEGIRKIEKNAPSGTKSQLRTLILRMLNDED